MKSPQGRISARTLKRLAVLFLFTAALCFGQEPSAGSEEPAPLWRWVNFAILAAGLGYLMSKNLPPFFESRSADIQKDISEAQKAKQESDQRAAAIDKRVAGLGADIEAFRAKARGEMAQEGERIRKETEALIRKIHDQAQSEIDSAGKTARREVRQYAANLALDLAGQRVRARLDANSEAALVDTFIGDLRAQESKN